MKKWFLVLAAFLFPTLAHAYEFAIIPSSIYSDFQTGDVHWDTIVIFAMHLIQLLITAAGIFAVILIMIGGFRIVLEATMEDQKSGKTSIRNTLIGFVVILLSWIMVDFTIAFLTSGY